jgi:adenosylhomocysteine nucleosidase
MLALMAAIAQELRSLKRSLQAREAFAQGACRIFDARFGSTPVLLVQSGMGRENAERAMNLLLTRQHIGPLLSIGFGGGLAESIDCGHIVLCSSFRCEQDSGAPVYGADARLLSRAQRAFGSEPALRMGRCLTVSRPVASLALRRRAARTFEADVADMESYWLARLAARHNIPFLGVRAITDTGSLELSPFDRCVRPDGRIAIAALLPALLRRPWLVSRGVSIMRRITRAQEALACFVARLIPSLAGQEAP